MSFIDYAVIAVYFVVVIGLGVVYRSRAAEDLDAYFLGGRRMHWLVLAMSGSVSTFDITGTMWIVSLLFVLGMRSMWNHWMWGWMMGAFFLAFMGKWVRRSNVMTGAEWMLTRFGDGAAGQTARTAYALMAVLTQATFIGYAFQGIGKFASVYVNLPEQTCALVIIGITTLYVVMGGLYSVVVTDVIQTVVLTIAAIIIAVVAYVHLSPAAIAAVLPPDWHSVMPTWRLPELAGDPAYGAYEFFGSLCIVWVLKGLLLNAGGPAQMYDFQRFLSARNSADASKLGAAWSFFLIVRWAMCMGLALLALTSMAGVTDPEKVMPMVLHDYLPVGLKGLVIAGLLAAFMSTFSSTVNSGASYLVRDLWQPLLRGLPDERRLVRGSYLATIAIVLVGIAIGLQAHTIREIWDWLMMALGAGVVIPNVLRWYWWRMNGWGYAAGTVAGIALSTAPLVVKDMPMQVSFPLICAGSLITSLAVSLVTSTPPQETLERFYRKVRPFGAWGPVKRAVALPPQIQEDPAESPWRAVFNTVVAMGGITALYLAPMYWVGHWHAQAALCAAVAMTTIATLAVTWYPYLPTHEED